VNRQRPEIDRPGVRGGYGSADHRGHILPTGLNACLFELDQDLDRGLVRAALPDQLDREVQVDVVPGSQGEGVARVVARANQFLGPPVLDLLLLGFSGNVKLGRSDVVLIR